MTRTPNDIVFAAEMAERDLAHVADLVSRMRADIANGNATRLVDPRNLVGDLASGVANYHRWQRATKDTDR